MKYSSSIYICLLVFLLLVSSSCEKNFLDINPDPNNPATASEAALLPSAQISYAFAFAGEYDRIAGSLVQQIVNQRYDRYAIPVSEASNAWQFDIFGGALTDLALIISQGTQNGNWHYVGIAKLQKAYVFSMMVDLYGDLPYSEATLGAEKIYPVYEDDAAIYDKIFLLIDEALADLDKTSAFSPNTTDLIYSQGTSANWIANSLPKWKKMGNTLKLKLYNQIRMADPNRAKTEINNLLSAGNLISAEAEDFQFAFGTSVAPDNRHPNYQSDYENAGRENYMSNYMNALLDTLNDPRIPYYFYNQDEGFFGRQPGDGNPAGNDANSRTVYGLYAVGGKYDNGVPGVVNTASGLGNAPLRMLTNYMRLFITAEAQLTLNNDVAAARAALEEGIRAALAKVSNYAVASSAPAIAAASRDAYVAEQLAEFDAAATLAARLNVIMTQKYIAQFGNGTETYNDYRRTGLPVLSTPPAPLGAFPLRLLYDIQEFGGPNPPTQPDITVPVFWDAN
jgi:hypothetical protein